MSGDAGEPQRDDDLLTAYVDGVAELAPEERRRIEARLSEDAEARADQVAVRGLLGQLRAMPPEGSEPDWAAMERSIRLAVGDSVPRPWWRNWRWLAPLATCATAALALLVLWPRPELLERPTPPPIAERSERPAPTEDTVALWLDGAEVDVDLSAAEILRGPEIGEYDPSQPDPEATATDEDRAALLPVGSLGWVDRLDDAAIDRAERWLASGSTDRAGSGGGALPRKKS